MLTSVAIPDAKRACMFDLALTRVLASDDRFTSRVTRVKLMLVVFEAFSGWKRLGLDRRAGSCRSQGKLRT